MQYTNRSDKCQCDSLLHNHTESHTCNIPTGVISVSVTVYYTIILSFTHAIPYSGYFSGGGGGGVKSSWFSWLSSEPQNIYP